MAVSHTEAVVRLIVELFGRALVFQVAQVAVTEPEEKTKDEFERAPVDPHSVGGCMLEHGDPCNASYHARDPIARRFGFHGSQE